MASAVGLGLVLMLVPVSPASAHEADPAVLRAAIAADTDRNIALLQHLVEQNSGTLNLEGVRRVGVLMKAELEPLGFQARWEDMAAVGRAGHLIATHTGNGRGKRVLLIAHLDTVFAADTPFTDFSRTGDRAVGPGVGDDKGGLVVIVASLRAMQAAGTLADADITVFLTGDEERTGAPTDVARGSLIAAGRAADVALEYEGLASQAGRDYATVARRGTTTWRVEATGVPGHSSRVGDGAGYGALYELARILDGFRTKLPEADATFNVGLAAGGTEATIDAEGVSATAAGRVNVIPEHAVAQGDLRTVTVEQDNRLRAAMRAIVEAHLPDTGATLTFFDGKPPMASSAGGLALLAALNDVNQTLGLDAMTPLPPSLRGAADSGFVAALIPTLGGMGLAGGGSHAEGEWADLGSLTRQALRSALLISRLASEPHE